MIPSFSISAITLALALRAAVSFPDAPQPGTGGDPPAPAKSADEDQDRKEIDEFEDSVAGRGLLDGAPSNLPIRLLRPKWYISMASGSWMRSGLTLVSVHGMDHAGARIPGAGSSDSNRHQLWSVESETFGDWEPAVLVHKCSMHMRIGFSFGHSRQRVVQKIGPGSYFKADGDPAGAFSSLTEWGVAFGGRAEIAHCNPLLAASILNFFYGPGMPLLGSDLKSGIRIGGASVFIFGIEGGFNYKRLPVENGEFLCRRLYGSWRCTQWDAGLFTGLHISDFLVLKVGAEYRETGVNAFFNERGSSPESWKIRATRYETGVYGEVMLLIYGRAGICVRAGTAGGGSCTLNLMIGIS